MQRKLGHFRIGSGIGDAHGAGAPHAAPSRISRPASVAAYALSPIDLIPDFIPVIGYLDDLLIVPLGILLAVKLVPADLLAEFREQAAGREKPTSRAGLVAIVATWIAAAIFLVWLFWSRQKP